MLSTIGPITRSARDLDLVSRMIMESSPWLVDPDCLPILYRPFDLPIRLSFACFTGDAVHKPNPTIAQGLQRVREALEALGHEVIEWTYPEPDKVKELIPDILRADGGAEGRIAI